MLKLLEIADAIAAEINIAANAGTFVCLTAIRRSPFAEVAFAPNIERFHAREMQCYVEPWNRIIHTGETQDSCTDEWMNFLQIVVCQRLDDVERTDQQPGEIDEVRGVVGFAEELADWVTSRLLQVTTPSGIARQQKPLTEQELINPDWLRQRMFYSQIAVMYG